MAMYYLLLAMLWVTLTFQLFVDGNGDGQRQPDEPGVGGLEYSVTWVDGNTSSVRLGVTGADGLISTTGQGLVTVESGCAVYHLAVDGDVAGQGVIALPCVWHLYLAQIGR